MTLERAAAVEAVGEHVIQLRLAERCDGCTGCGGRCCLFGALRPDGDRIDLPRDWCECEPQVGSRMRIYLPDRQLLRQARIGYGLPALGLLIGALFGHWLAEASTLDADATSAVAAMLGTLTGLAFSKRASPMRCRIAPAD